jgi:methionyl-tRNA synthetase
MGTVLYTTAEVLRRVAIMTQAYIPTSSAKLLDILGIAEDKRSFADLGDVLVSGAELPAPEPIFPRYVETEE